MNKYNHASLYVDEKSEHFELILKNGEILVFDKNNKGLNEILHSIVFSHENFSPSKYNIDQHCCEFVVNNFKKYYKIKGSEQDSGFVVCRICNKKEEEIFENSEQAGGLSVHSDGEILIGNYGSFEHDMHSYMWVNQEESIMGTLCDECVNTLLKENKIKETMQNIP